MTLGHLILRLEALDPDTVVRWGFAEPHTDRGDYYDLAFDPAENVTVGSMLAYAKGAMGSSYKGYKGGVFVMGNSTSVRIGEWGMVGDGISDALLRYWADERAVRSPQEAA